MVGTEAKVEARMRKWSSTALRKAMKGLSVSSSWSKGSVGGAIGSLGVTVGDGGSVGGLGDACDSACLSDSCGEEDEPKGQGAMVNDDMLVRLTRICWFSG